MNVDNLIVLPYPRLSGDFVKQLNIHKRKEVKSMKQLKKWLEKKGIDNYKIEMFGNDYFYNVPAPKYKAFHFAFELTSDQQKTKKALENIEKIKKYCERYGYDCFNEFNIFGYTSYIYFYVANRNDREKLYDYIRFMEMSVLECDQLRHLKGNYPGLNEDMKKIMNDYETYYLDFLKAMKIAA